MVFAIKHCLPTTTYCTMLQFQGFKQRSSGAVSNEKQKIFRSCHGSAQHKGKLVEPHSTTVCGQPWIWPISNKEVPRALPFHTLWCVFAPPLLPCVASAGGVLSFCDGCASCVLRLLSLPGRRAPHTYRLRTTLYAAQQSSYLCARERGRAARRCAVECCTLHTSHTSCLAALWEFESCRPLISSLVSHTHALSLSLAAFQH